MRPFLRFIAPAVSAIAFAACSDQVSDPVSSAPHGGPSPQTMLDSEVWKLADVEADFPGAYSFDTTQAGLSATPYIAPADPSSAERDFCRDHFKPIDLWWDGGWGLMRFHLDPPLLFVGYNPGTFRSPRNLVFRKVVYETIRESEATDPAGNVWRFQGRFNALCRGGALEIGPVVFGGQVLVSQNPLNIPRMVRAGPGGGDGCGGGGGEEDEWYAMESYDPYDPHGPVPAPDGDLRLSCGGGGNGDGGMGFNPDDFTCSWEYLTIEVTRDGGVTWEHYWSGWAQVCDEAEE